jgi:two-component system chemotaxis sensor kinase CheA
VTDVSGRGVGMDVVKRAVDDLGGEILIHTKVGAGTEFHIVLPSTLSILDAVVVSLNDSLYAVPLQDIEEVVALAGNHIETSANAGRLINLRGRVMPLERLSSFLPNKHNANAATDGVALVAAVNGRALALEVDRIVGQQQIVVRPLEEKLAKVPGYTGATILSTGEPSMIVYLPHVIKSYMAGMNQ